MINHYLRGVLSPSADSISHYFRLLKAVSNLAAIIKNQLRAATSSRIVPYFSACSTQGISQVWFPAVANLLMHPTMMKDPERVAR